MFSTLSYLHALWFLWWHVTHRRWTWCTSPREEKPNNKHIYGFSKNTILPRGMVRVTIWHTLHAFPTCKPIRQRVGLGMKKEEDSLPACLTRPSPGLILVSWTSSRQADWLIRGSEVVLTVWSQMLFKILDCRGKDKKGYQWIKYETQETLQSDYKRCTISFNGVSKVLCILKGYNKSGYAATTQRPYPSSVSCFTPIPVSVCMFTFLVQGSLG